MDSPVPSLSWITHHRHNGPTNADIPHRDPRQRTTRTRVNADSLSALDVRESNLWIRRVLVRAQEGQLRSRGGRRG